MDLPAQLTTQPPKVVNGPRPVYAAYLEQAYRHLPNSSCLAAVACTGGRKSRSSVTQAERDVLSSHAKLHQCFLRSLEEAYCGDRLAGLWTR